VYSLKDPFKYVNRTEFPGLADFKGNVYRSAVPVGAPAGSKVWANVEYSLGGTGSGSVNYPAKPLIEYTISGGKISEVLNIGTYIVPNTGTVNPSGSILTITGQQNKLIDSSVLVYVKDGNDISLGSIKDLLDKDIKEDAWYITDKDGRVKALLVDTKDTGANSIFVMVSSVSSGSNTGGDFNIVSGLEWADGVNAAIKSWDYTDATLQTTHPVNYPVVTTYPTMLKFTIGENGVLKNIEVLANISASTDIVRSAAFQKRSGGQSGTFQLTYTTPGSIDINGDGKIDGTDGDSVAFEANTVLYKVDGNAWKAYAPSEANFRADVDSAGNLNGRYVFMKTDDEKAFDVIIKYEAWMSW
jgi:hypothetical protein